MADSKITALAALTAADPVNDMFPVVDVSDTSMAASGTTKRISANNILSSSPTASGAFTVTGLVTAGSATITGDLTVATDRLKVVTGSTAVQIGATTQTQFGTTAWPTSYIGKSGSRVLIGSTGELILWNEAAAAIGNNSTLFIGAKSGPVATLISGGAIKGGIENTSDYSGFLTFSTQRSDASMIERYRIASDGVATWSNVGGVAGTAMTLNSTGLGVGASPELKLRVDGPDAAPATSGSSTTNGAFRIGAAGASTNLCVDSGVNTTGSVYGWFQARSRSNYATNYDLVLQPNGGKLLAGQTSVGEDGVVSIKGSNGLGVEATANGGSTFNAKYSGTGTGYFGYFKYGTTLVGTIASTGAGNCTFNQVSDYRLKEDVQPIVGALNRINSLKPSTYKWKVNGSAGEGFLAHELAAGVPLAVTGEKDAIDKNGEINPQQVDLSKVVPILVAAIQELTARVQTLEAK